MMSIKNIFLASSLVLLLASLNACKHSPDAADSTPAPAPPIEQSAIVEKPLSQPQLVKTPEPLTLPVRFQTPSYMLDEEGKDTLEEEEITSIKVGASIRSTRGPQPLWDILKRLAALKGMNVSWASDVDQKVLVDVDISANDDFYDAIDNLLRQVDYFHVIQGNTIVVKYKETRRFHIAMPFTKQNYTTGTGGNVLGSAEESNNIDGTIELKSSDNEFDIWQNIKENMDAIINTWNTASFTPPPAVADTEGNAAATSNADDDKDTGQLATRQISSGGSMYIIDKPIGVVTVTAPRPLLDRLEVYFDTLKQQLYKQITIEAKIIEVQLEDATSLGIDWSNVLKDFPINGTINFGDAAGQIYPSNGAKFVSSVTLNSAGFGVFLNALNEQGDTRILSNPKISVMNGQPALISVGRNVTYIDSIDSDLDTDTGVITYKTKTERILSGIGMALTATILDDNDIIMNLVPVTSELSEPIEYRSVGNLGGEVGLPIVNVREMSTTVRVKNGDMLVIGGLISNTDDKNEAFAPIVGDVPVLRYLFGKKETLKRKRELIVLLRPVII